MSQKIKATKEILNNISVNDAIQYIINNAEKYKMDNNDCEKVINLNTDEFLLNYYTELKKMFYDDTFDSKEELMSELAEFILDRFNQVWYGEQTELYK